MTTATLQVLVARSNAPTAHGLCQCGCGGRTRLATRSNPGAGIAVGDPMRYIAGHHAKSETPAYVEDAATGCWVWQRAQNAKGYGWGWHPEKKRVYLAHRLFYEGTHGDVPEGMQLDHLCRNRACVNPEHLEVVTPAENQRRGLKTKVTREQALEARRRCANGENRSAVARDMGISRDIVSQIANRRTWADLTEEAA